MSELSFAIHRRDKRLNFRNCFFRFSFNFPADRYRSFDDSMSNVSLALINIHFSSGTVRPYLPNMIEIGGIQVKPKPSPLPQVNEEDNFLMNSSNWFFMSILGSPKLPRWSQRRRNLLQFGLKHQKHILIARSDCDSSQSIFAT